MNLRTLKRQAAHSARELLMIRPYLMGRCLRRWYLRKLLDHYEISARIEDHFAQQHTECAKHFRSLALGVESELEALQAKIES